MQHHPVVSREEWLAARKALLAKEKEATHLRDKINAERLALPWVKVEKNYLFDTPKGKRSLAELFAGRSQLIIYHFMLGPGWEAGCDGCSFLADHLDGALPHLEHHDVTLDRGFARAACRDRALSSAHGLAISLGLFLRQRFQLRLPRVLHQG